MDRTQEQTKIRYPSPNTAFLPEWDVVEAIIQTVSQARLDAVYTWVKGHQEKGKPYDKLSFLSQLNVDTDQYAGDYQKEFGSYRPTIPLSAARPAALDIDGKTIHRQMKTAMRNAAHKGPLLHRTITRNNWQDHVPTLIDWEAHCLATNG